MGIDYVIPHSCVNRSELGESGLRRWAFLYMIFKYLREHPDLEKKGLEGRQWRLPSLGLEDVDVKRFDYDDVREVGSEIGSYIGRCQDCPANMDPKADEFGCVGRINYPILACFEDFLGERVQKVMDLRGPEAWPTLLNLIIRSDGPFDGTPLAKLRLTELRNGSRLMERTEAVPLRRAGDGISTDHILHALLGLASLEHEESGYSRTIPRELVGLYVDFLAGVLYSSLPEERVLELSRQCSTYLQFRWLHRALRLSYRLDCSLLLH